MDSRYYIGLSNGDCVIGFEIALKREALKWLYTTFFNYA